ncbi:MAG: glutamate--tRNA ligase [Elusimicrobia bacterium RIFCSPLOWO2_01_FULL_59_12]|nr:MAG: glutamate--tRNA ligase [Elusimicrobia bacterium RIFCSPLOWO2_01_FULL_59_12]
MAVKNPSVRVRFAPSPTGYLHIGGARTALFNWLFARHHQGAFILRIEDTDEVRSTAESVNGILESMRWLGLDWDEGPVYADGVAGLPEQSLGNKGPYYQMQRLKFYQDACSRLLAQDHAYPCYCTPDEVDKMRKIAELSKRPPKYDGACRGLTDDQRKKKEAEGRKKSVRFKTPQEGDTDFTDLVRGALHFENNLLEDFVILKTSGVPTYNFACVVDDHGMDISHVIRGEDHLSNTPRQVLVYRALGWEPPQFAHLAMIHGSDGGRLSKRHGATSVREYKEAGYLPAALLNYLALLGWGTEDSQQVFTPKDMIEKFALERCTKSAAAFDPAKLLWMNGEYVRKTPVPDLAKIARTAFASADSKALEGAIALEREKIKLLTDIPKLVDFLISDEYEYRQEAVDKVLRVAGVGDILSDMEKRLDSLTSFDSAGIEAAIKACAKDRGVKNAAVIHPLRVAVSGRTEGPSLYHMIEYLGKARSLQRMKKAQSLLAAGKI